MPSSGALRRRSICGVGPVVAGWPRAAFSCRRRLSAAGSTMLPAGPCAFQNTRLSTKFSDSSLICRVSRLTIWRIFGSAAVAPAQQGLLACGAVGGAGGLLARGEALIVAKHRPFGLLRGRADLGTRRAGLRRAQLVVGRQRQRRARYHAELVRRLLAQAELLVESTARGKTDRQARDREKSKCHSEIHLTSSLFPLLFYPSCPAGTSHPR